MPYGVSDEAQAFLRTAPEPDRRVLDSDSVPAIRQDIRDGYAERIRRSRDRFQPRMTDTEHGGVACLEVEPTDGADGLVILYCFGGGFIFGSPMEDLAIVAALAQHAGARVICPWYRLAPEHPYPAAVEDVMAVYRSLAGSVPPDRLTVAGESAGGNLALTILLGARRWALPMPRAAALMSPACDLTFTGDSHSANDGRDPSLSMADIPAKIGLYAGTADPTEPRLSPLFGAYDDGFPPVLITSGTRDLFLSQCVRLASTLRAAGIAAELRVWEDMWHVFEFYDELPEAAASLREIAAFLTAAGGEPA